MKDVLKGIWEMLTVPIEDNIVGWILIILMWLLFIMLVGIIIFGILSAFNSWFTPVVDGVGIIIGKYFEESHTTTVLIYNAATKSQMPHTTYHPDAWRIEIQISDLTDSIYVDKEKYIQLKVPQSVPVKYTNGRLWKSLNIKEVYA